MFRIRNRRDNHSAWRRCENERPSISLLRFYSKYRRGIVELRGTGLLKFIRDKRGTRGARGPIFPSFFRFDAIVEPYSFCTGGAGLDGFR